VDEPVLIAPQSVGRHGSIPELIRLPSLDKEIQYIAERSRQFYEQGIPWQKIAILYRSHYIGEKIFSYFQKEHIPIDWLGKDPDSRFFNPSKPGIKVLTMHSSKGLEFPVVFIAGLGTLPNRNATPQAEARLLYVAMTRSTETLILTYSQESEFTKKMKTAYSKVIPQD
jgi:superfamily I DNA/RNA helicase